MSGGSKFPRANYRDASHVLRDDAIRQKTFYYIHFTETIDAIKWKVFGMVKNIEDVMGATSRSQGYVCPVCGRRYDLLDIVANQSPDGSGFLCDDCGNILVEDDSQEENLVNQEKQRRLHDQIKPIIGALMKIDELVIPENTFESSLAIALPPDPSKTPTLHKFSSLPTARADATAQQNLLSLQVNITSNTEASKLERRAEEEKVRMAEENALPTWHVESTVGKTLFSSRANDQSQIVSKPMKSAMNDVKLKVEEKVQPVASDDVEDAVSAYYAQMSNKQQSTDDDDDGDGDDDGDDDDDDDEFEDVPPAPAPVVATVGELDGDESDDD